MSEPTKEALEPPTNYRMTVTEIGRRWRVYYCSGELANWVSALVAHTVARYGDKLVKIPEGNVEVSRDITAIIEKYFPQTDPDAHTASLREELRAAREALEQIWQDPNLSGLRMRVIARAACKGGDAV